MLAFMHDHTPLAAAGLASILTASTAPWWVPVVIQLTGLALAYLNGRTAAKAKEPPPQPPLSRY